VVLFLLLIFVPNQLTRTLWCIGNQSTVMGLDMYLEKRVYIGAEYKHRNVKGKVAITIDGKPVKISFNKISTITERVGYWRKANAIHKWFVNNCQEGNDDCREAYVSKEQIEELLKICKTIKKNKDATAIEQLPPQEGDFFGSTDIDEGYYQDIDDTIKILSGLVKEKEWDFSIYYTASW